VKIPFEVIYEDNHLLVINKPAGMLVQGDKTGDESLLEIGKQYIKEKYQKPGNVFLGSAHRLDRPVSGVLVFARTSKALSRMQELFREKQVQKTYYAVVKPAPDYEFQELKHWIAKDKTKNISRAYDKDGKIIRTAERFKNIELPNSVKAAVLDRFPEWTITKDTYVTHYYEKKGVTKKYKLKLENGDKVLRVKLDENGKFL